jgi:hypothetical protein
MLNDEIRVPGMNIELPLLAAADLQDHLMTACNDLDRLQTLLAHACEDLIASFHGATADLDGLQGVHGASPGLETLHSLRVHLVNAITALQFQDMASQLVAHTHSRLRSCADRLARDTMGDDEDGEAVVESGPLRPNPVTQDEMDAGSVELF